MYDSENPLSAAQLTQLLADLNPSRVAQRKQGGATLSYLEAWDVRASLIKVFGFGGWSSELLDTQILHMEQSSPSFEYNSNRDAPKRQKKDALGNPVFNWVVAARATVRLTIHQLSAVYTEAAVASQTGPDIGEVADFAVKTAESDAFKRAAMNLGTTFGLSLYNSGELGDVVRATRDPQQSRILREHREAQQKEAPMLKKTTEGVVAETGANPGTGEMPAAGPVGPAKYFEDGTDPQAMALAHDQVAGAFRR